VTLPGTGGTVSFKYDQFGRRVYKSSSTGTSVYAYDGNNLIEEMNSSGGVVARYTQTGTIDESLAMLRSSTTSYYQADGLGSVTSLSTGVGALANAYTYDSYGKTTPTGSIVNSFQYTGREFDTETNLYFYRARYYDPQTGRFLNEDPAGFAAGTDFYAYVSNNSTNLVDPTGLLQVCSRPAHLPLAYAWAKLTLQPVPCHVFLRLTDGHTLGGYFNKELDGFGNLVTRPDDDSDFRKYAPEAKCKDVPGNPCENDAKAKNAFGSSKTLGAYGFGPTDAGTSNDAAARILNDAGISFNLPVCAWGKNAGYSPYGPPTMFSPARPPLFGNF
jgi:RHS repeat-associated protein